MQKVRSYFYHQAQLEKKLAGSDTFLGNFLSTKGIYLQGKALSVFNLLLSQMFWDALFQTVRTD